jgi:DNA-binding response OmpR family regulator
MGSHILVIEDSAPIRRLVEICLRDLGRAVASAGDGPSGLKAALEDPPGLIILDIGLPGLNGWDVLGRLREDPRGEGIPVLILTAHASEEDRFRTGGDGADAFMTKPFDPADLLTTAGRLLQTRAPAGRSSPAAAAPRE